MRISQHKMYNIRKEIMSDLYGAHLKKISEEKEVFLRKNLALEYAPYKEFIAKIYSSFSEKILASSINPSIKSFWRFNTLFLILLSTSNALL